MAALAVLTGSSDSVQPVHSLNELQTRFDITHTSRGAARFDPDELAGLSARTLHVLEFESVRERLEAHDIAGHKAEPFWNAVRGNLVSFLDVVAWWRVVEGEIIPVVEDRELLQAACRLLPVEPWDHTTFGAWANAVKQETGRKGKALFHPLRLALTGRDQGPELAALLPLIGHIKASARLS